MTLTVILFVVGAYVAGGLTYAGVAKAIKAKADKDLAAAKAGVSADLSAAAKKL
jgi:hypothetical protein